jgi:Tfp pilus assembly protein PilF
MLLSGCASTMQGTTPPPPVFADAKFAPPSEKVDASDLFTLSAPMRAYLNSQSFQSHLRNKGSRQGLIDALYSKSDLKLEYESRLTRTASETYEARVGNCLSLVVMTAAFAKELGMKVRYQSVDVENAWSRSGDLYMASAHINIALGSRINDIQNGYDVDRALVVDFLPPADAKKFRTRELDEEDVIALYQNNRAAESLVQGRLDDAYWWAKAAVATRPGMVAPLNTLGVIYQRHGDPLLAERSYRTALEREPENLAVLRNLQPLLVELGRPAEAQELAKRIASIEPYPPYYFFDKGMVALKAGDFDEARDMFAREVKRAPYNDEFRFWLGIAHLRLGKLGDAREHIAVAIENSTRRDNRDVYSAKLAYLRRMTTTGTHIR